MNSTPLCTSQLPLRLRLARLLGRVLPPIAAPTVAHRFHPFALGCQHRLQWRARALTGSTIMCASDEVHQHHFLMLGYYDWRLVTVAQTVCSPGDVIVEVGANVGTETIGFADIVGRDGRVYAFEPLPSNAARLQSSIATACGPRLQFFQLALADREGKFAFVPPEVDRLTGTGHLAPDSEPVPNLISVRVSTLDKLLRSTRARLLAMDVEGSELAVLRGGRWWIRHYQPVIVLEASAITTRRMGGSLDELEAELRVLGYNVRKIGRYGLTAPDTRADAAPCNWVAVPAHEAALLPRISRRILLCGSLPPWPGINPLVMPSVQSADPSAAPAPSSGAREESLRHDCVSGDASSEPRSFG
jgi:FkbM family methyltransferase